MGNIVNRVFDSSGPEGKVRGTPQQIIDKYNQLARDAQVSGDRVATENFQQHAEHYLRMLAEAQREQQERQAQQQNTQGNQNSGQDRQARSGGNGSDAQGGQPRGGNNGPAQPQQARDDDAPQDKRDDVIDVSESDDSVLVETPENRGGRTRKPRKKPEPDTQAKQDDTAPSDAAE